MNKSAQIRQYISVHYPCQQLPAGSTKEICDLFGVSRQLLHQIVLGMGLQTGGPVRNTPRLFCACGKEADYSVTREKFRKGTIDQYRCINCRKRQYTLFVSCTKCGKELKRTISQLKRTKVPVCLNCLRDGKTTALRALRVNQVIAIYDSSTKELSRWHSAAQHLGIHTKTWVVDGTRYLALAIDNQDTDVVE